MKIIESLIYQYRGEAEISSFLSVFSFCMSFPIWEQVHTLIL